MRGGFASALLLLAATCRLQFRPSRQGPRPGGRDGQLVLCRKTPTFKPFRAKVRHHRHSRWLDMRTPQRGGNSAPEGVTLEALALSSVRTDMHHLRRQYPSPGGVFPWSVRSSRDRTTRSNPCESPDRADRAGGLALRVMDVSRVGRVGSNGEPQCARFAPEGASATHSAAAGCDLVRFEPTRPFGP